jgi:hypothetical protein
VEAAGDPGEPDVGDELVEPGVGAAGAGDGAVHGELHPVGAEEGLERAGQRAGPAADGAVDLSGQPELVRAFARWFTWSHFAPIVRAARS